MLITVLQMSMNRQCEGFSLTVYAYSNNSIDGAIIYFSKNKNMSKLEIILIIFKCCESKIYIIILLPKLKCTHNQIDYIGK